MRKEDREVTQVFESSMLAVFLFSSVVASNVRVPVDQPVPKEIGFKETSTAMGN